MSLGIITPTNAVVARLDKSEVTPRMKKNMATLSALTIAGVGAIEISERTFGKSFKWNTAINKSLKNFVNNTKDFVGSGTLKNIAGKVAKTTGRQKLLGALAIGTLALVMGIREHFSKKEGAAAQRDTDAKATAEMLDKQEMINDNKIIEKDAEITTLKAELDIEKNQVKSLYDTIEKIDKAAEKLGVDKELAAEVIKDIQNPKE